MKRTIPGLLEVTNSVGTYHRGPIHNRFLLTHSLGYVKLINRCCQTLFRKSEIEKEGGEALLNQRFGGQSGGLLPRLDKLPYSSFPFVNYA